ncbi:hypothetical protein M2352_000248 [Azospirillum fermentarium]|uniref:DUF475 domain-containing protein n=1 Tax=Azospirillum fermentarium TaxID=1233114 RepID=UPI002226B094|nr:DUF475 domain-containing protein [Azospirillum fermentarium]MCW2244657.1 hypothetical protein [Azospirillum fermentarium]
MPNLKYFTNSFLFTGGALVAGGAIGWAAGGLSGMLSYVLICAILGVMEVSLSLDNAVVNATVLKDMDPVWQHRFLTWGIWIAVFGMRIVFPLLIVSIAAWINPAAAIKLALFEPERYAKILTDAHIGIAGFGGAFLLMVGLKYFFDAEKEVHWIGGVERALTKFSDIEAVEIVIALLTLYGFSRAIPGEEAMSFLVSGIFGLITFIGVEALGSFMESATEHGDGEGGERVNTAVRSGAATFIYLEVLDASFSFDGVIGAFALSNNLFVIALGLGIGAVFVRSMTIMLVEKGTLAEYRYLENGAFWAILALALIMFLQTVMHIPEVVTGLIGATLIGLSLWSSVTHNRRAAALVQADEMPAAVE